MAAEGWCGKQRDHVTSSTANTKRERGGQRSEWEVKPQPSNLPTHSDVLPLAMISLQTVPPTTAQVSKSVTLWGAFLMQTTTTHISKQ